MATDQKSFRFSTEMIHQLEVLSQHLGENYTDVIRRLIAERYASLFGEIGRTKIELDFDGSFPEQVDPVPVLAYGSYKGKKFFALLSFPRDDMVHASRARIMDMAIAEIDDEVARYDEMKWGVTPNE